MSSSVDAGRDERARNLAAADSETEFGRRFGGLEPGAGRIDDARRRRDRDHDR